jgi:hypothetical protein
MTDSQGKREEGVANSYTNGSEVCWYADLDLDMTSMRGTCQMKFRVQFWDDSSPECDAETFFVSVSAGELIVDENAPPPSLSKYNIRPSCYIYDLILIFFEYTKADEEKEVYHNFPHNCLRGWERNF